MKFYLGLSTVVVWLGCSKGQPVARADAASPTLGQVRAFSSGRNFEVIRVEHVSNDLGPTLVFDYKSKAKPGDVTALRLEVEEVWTDLQKDADADRVAAVFVVPHQADNTSTAFVLRRNPDGTWRKSSGLWER